MWRQPVKRWNVLAATLPVVGLSLASACTPPQTTPGSIILDVNTSNQGTFQVAAGVPFTRTTVFQSGGTDPLSSGVVVLTPEEVVIETGGSGTRSLQVWLYLSDSSESQDEACGGAISDEYGPFTVTIDDDDNVIGLEAGTTELTSRSLELLQSGQPVRLCVKVVSDFDIAVTFNQVSFELIKQ